MLQIQQIIKKYENASYNVLNLSNFSIQSGEMIQLMGVNGVGKTTFLSVLAGLSHFEGEIILDGFSIRKDYQRYLSKISYVGNQFFLYDFLTGEEMIQLVQEMASIGSIIDEDLLFFISDSGLSGYLHLYTKEMSLGTKQKLSIFLALLISPKLFLMDEPFVNLDEPSKEALKKLLKSRSKTGMMTIYATHSKEENFNDLADKTAYLLPHLQKGADLIWP
ncbi:MAG: ABC transporter ATP-binding protein [Lactobacillales bacterium]|nr:ABC transporter ATP-binding protein [Lactobacillales bacterium]